MKLRNYAPLLPQLNEYNQAHGLWYEQLELIGMKFIGGERQGSTNYHFHRHTFWEFHLLLEGSPQQYLIGGQPVTLKKGGAMLISSDTDHMLCKTEGSVPDTKLGIQFYLPVKQDWIAEDILLSVRQRLYLGWEASDGLQDIAKYISCNIPLEQNNAVELLGHAISILLCHLADGLRQELGVEPISHGEVRTTLSAKGAFCETVVTYMKNHLEGIPSIEELCSQFAVSPRQLNRNFNAYYGKSCIEVWNQLRKNYASELLRNTDLRIDDISERLGYTNVANFIRFFKREEGMSPAFFRKDHTADYKGDTSDRF